MDFTSRYVALGDSFTEGVGDDDPARPNGVRGWADRVKLNTLSAGMTFGELALGSGNRQETTVRAVGPVEVMVLSAEAISELEATDPRLAIALWKALTRDAYTRVEQYLRESAVRIRE